MDDRYLIDINLRNTLPEVTLPTTLQYLYLYNVNLNKVPSSLSNLTKLSNLDLSKNYLTEFPEDGSDFVTALGSSLTTLYAGAMIARKCLLWRRIDFSFLLQGLGGELADQLLRDLPEAGFAVRLL